MVQFDGNTVITMCDSKYVVKCMTDWAFEWQEKNVLRCSGGEQRLQEVMTTVIGKIGSVWSFW